MGNKTKIGKQRKDRFYHLAKETGFRSRASFKLIQLNRRFEFLQKARVCVDLCAAPGGWMQVAKQTMPVSSIVIGVDLFPIKPVAGCLSIQEDITTDKCRVAIQQALQTWKADVVLNDGAPNVGKNWLHDAYQQSCLTLSALKLATKFLRPGGWFVTKIFRSKDYNPLLWVFKQLFKKVHSTKPQASRLESAEIFVVCQHYIAPDKLDARFLDPKYVFEDLQLEPSTKHVLHPEKVKKVKAQGYADGETMLHPVPVSVFMASEDGVSELQKATEIVFDDETVADNPLTTTEIKECCKDIKVLGRKDLKLLMAWWKAVRGEKKKALSGEDVKGAVTEELEFEEDEDDALDSKVAQMEKEEMLEARRKRKVANKTRRKLQTLLDLKMVLKGDEGPTVQEKDLFNLSQVPGTKGLKKVLEQTPEILAESDSDSDTELPPRKIKYSKDGPEHLHSSGTHYTEEESESEDEGNMSPVDGLGLEESEDESDTEDVADIPKPAPANPLVTDLDPRSKDEKRSQKAKLWFEKDIFRELGVNESTEKIQKSHMKYVDYKGDDTDSDNDEEGDESDYEEQLNKEWKKNVNEARKSIRNGEQRKEMEDLPSDNDELEGSESEQDGEEEEEEEEKKVEEGEEEVMKDQSSDAREKPGKQIKLNAKELALGALMITSRKVKRDIMDAGWNKYAFNDDNLPDWFVEDEKKHMRKEVPVPKHLLEQYKKQERDLDARSIKKVVEAKARKKKRLIKRMEKAKKKVEAVMENVDISDREKARQVRQFYKHSKGEKKRELTYVVARKYMSAKRMPRPQGVKGSYKMVDPRMKKDNRRKQLDMKTKGKGKGRGRGRGRGRDRQKDRRRREPEVDRSDKSRKSKGTQNGNRRGRKK